MNCATGTSATRQVRQRWFSVGIFPPGPLFGLTGNHPQSAPACSFLRCMGSFAQAERHSGFSHLLVSGTWQNIRTSNGEVSFWSALKRRFSNRLRYLTGNRFGTGSWTRRFLKLFRWQVRTVFWMTGNRPTTSATRQARRRWFSVGGSPLDFLVLPDRKSPAVRPCV